jgi:ATP-binding cassette subfamily B protein
VLVFGAIVFVLWLGAQAVLQGRMSAGELTQFILYAAIVAGSVGALSEVMGDVQRAAGAAERLLELLAAQPRIVGPGASAQNIGPAPGQVPASASASASTSASAGASASASASARPPRHAGASVSFDAVNFHYPSRPAEAALVDLNLSVEPGETIALVGPSGAGKTTVFSLLLRFYDPQSGAVRLDGVDLRQFEPTALRERIGPGLPGQRGVLGRCDGEHPLRPARSLRRRGQGRRRGGARRRIHRPFAAGLPHVCRRTRVCACRAASASGSRSRARC